MLALFLILDSFLHNRPLINQLKEDSCHHLDPRNIQKSQTMIIYLQFAPYFYQTNFSVSLETATNETKL